MNDLISRQAAIAALMNSELGSWNNDDYERGARAQHLDDVAAIKSVPSVRKKRKPSAQPDYDLSGYSDRLWKAAYERGKAEAEPRWIPVEDEPPKEKKRYWICTDTGYQCECRWTNNIYGMRESDNWGWSIFDIPQYSKVVAYMSLPKPYERR